MQAKPFAKPQTIGFATSGQFDAVVDFDAATRDSADPKRFRAEAGSPDMLHPGDPGYKLMADAIDLSIFSASRAPKSQQVQQED